MSRTASIEAATWLTPLRSDARARFDALGIPKPTDEDWRHTNVQPVAPFATTVADSAQVSSAWIDALPLATTSACRLVLVNGRYDAAASGTGAPAAGVHLGSLAAALAAGAEALETVFGTVATFDDRAFVALNTALFADGALVIVDAGIDAPVPVHIVHVAVPSAEPRTIHPRTLVLAGAGSRVTVVESFVTFGTDAYLTNAVTEVIVGASAQVEHVRVQTEHVSAWHVATVAARQAKDSRFGSHNVSLGAALTRNDVGSRLDGEGAECHLYGLYVADGTQHVDNHTSLDHAVPNCPSWEMYKGVLAGSARAVFNGRIVVRPDAQKTDAKQSNKNLLLSGGAVVHTRPQLEIYANDVKCTHGATIGRLDETSLFYLRTRGIGRDEARDLLIHAFADDVLGKIPIAAVREGLAASLHQRLARDLTGADTRP
jgi:Fe-S cluster assembly protein SufD